MFNFLCLSLLIFVIGFHYFFLTFSSTEEYSEKIIEEEFVQITSQTITPLIPDSTKHEKQQKQQHNKKAIQSKQCRLILKNY